ncbi:MAG: cell division protein ZipA [Shewanella sp.]|uniref:cell division protein ZipA n=1 Tax=Shewanella sp. TaxID=50422 RepID=UPI003F3F6251
MEDLQLVLFVLGAIAIVAVLIHGFWSIRKQQPKSIKDSPMGHFYKQQADKAQGATKRIDAEGFDADGIGAVRVRKAADVPSHDAPVAINPYLKQEPKLEPKFEPKLESSPDTKREPNVGREPNFGFQPIKPFEHETQAVVNTEPRLSSPAAQPDFSLQPPLAKEPSRSHKAPRQETLAPQAGKSHAAMVAQKVAEQAQAVHAAPKQTALFDDEQAYQEDHYQDDEYQDDSAATEPGLGEPRDVLVLHVVAKEGRKLNGAELLPCFLTLNFKYGDMNIFHRHVDNAGNGKVLFSIANMLKPGVFDPDNMEQFSTQGVVFFMTLPCYGDALMNFSIMLNSARQLADDIDAVVLDGQRQPWGEFTKQDYLHRIRANA